MTPSDPEGDPPPTSATASTAPADRGSILPDSPLGWALLLISLTIYSAFAGAVVAGARRGVGPGGAPLFYDFAVFYQAGALALKGHAAAAYDDTRFIAAVQAAFPGSSLRLPWSYPPTFQLVLAPLALLPYGVAYLVWNTGLLTAFGAVCARLAATSRRWCLVLAPGVAVNALFGQNGVLSAALMGAGVLWLKTRPILAGVLLGGLAYKPQIAVLTPLVLVAARAWKPLAAAVASQIIFSVLAGILLGWGGWAGFLAKMVHPAGVAAASSSSAHAIPSLQVLAADLGAPPPASMILHALGAAGAVAAALVVWRRREDAALRLAVLGSATLLISPYLRAYDMILLLPAVALVLDRASPHLFARAAAAAAWLAPALLMFVPTKIQYGALVSLAMLVTTCVAAWSAPTGSVTLPPRGRSA